MKKLLVLAGGSKRNQAWGEACAEYFKNQFDLTCFIRYDHWETGEPNIDFAVELEKVAITAEGAGEKGDWYIFAKSIGSILALKAVAAGAVEPKNASFSVCHLILLRIQSLRMTGRCFKISKLQP